MLRLCCVSLLELIATFYLLQGILLTNIKISATSLDLNTKSDFQQINNTHPINNSTRNLHAQERKLKFFKVFKKGAKLGPKQKKTFKFITKTLPQLYQQFTQPIYQPAPPVKFKHKKKKAPIQCIPIEYLQHLRPQQGNRYKEYEYVYDDEDDEDYSVLDHLGGSGHGHYAPHPHYAPPGIPIFHPYRRISNGYNGKRRFWRIQPPPPSPTVPQVIHTLIAAASIPPKIYGFLKLVNAGRNPQKPADTYPSPLYGNQQMEEEKFTTPYSTRHYYSSKYRNESLNNPITEPPLDRYTTQKYIPSNPIIFGINKAQSQLFQPAVENSGQQIIAYNKNYVNYLNSNANNMRLRNEENYVNANQNFGLRNVTFPKVIFSPIPTEAYRGTGVEKWRAIPNYNQNIGFTANGNLDHFLPSNVNNKTSSVGSYQVNEDFMEISTQPQYLLKPKIRN